MPSSAHASRSDPIGASAAASSRARLTRAGLRRVIRISSLGCAISIDLPPAPPFVTENAEPSIRSENQLERKLDTAGPTASEEGIPYPHIPSCRERQVAHAATRPIANAAGRRIGDEGRQVGIGEVRMVRQVVEFGAELDREPLGERGVLEDRKIKLAERSEEHTSELQSLAYLVCRLLLQK